MRILYAVQRYGESIVGGAEAATRSYAEHLVGRGHAVEVITSCAHSYVDWANAFEPGTSTFNGVTVHRLPAASRRTTEGFGPIHGWMMAGPRPAPLLAQATWVKRMGPDLVGLTRWLAAESARFDVVVFMTYLYSTTTLGLPATAGRVPTILQPTAHDEPPIWLTMFDTLFRQPDAFLFFTPEEREFVARRFALDPAGRTLGIGIGPTPTSDVNIFRQRHGLGDNPYLVYVGRIDAIKGSRELFHFFTSWCDRRPANGQRLKLVFVGERFDELPEHHDIVFTGFLDEHEKAAALAGSLALVQPSRFESFSIVLCEAWMQARPALVHADCGVLVGQASRSRGAIPYRGFAEFEAAVDMLLERPDLADALGRNGRAFVEQEYRWDHVLDVFEETVALATDRFSERRHRQAPATELNDREGHGRTTASNSILDRSASAADH